MTCLHTLATLGGLVFLCACDPQPSPALHLIDARSNTDEAALDHRAFIAESSIWRSANPLVVCWDRGFAGRELEMDWVRLAVEGTWERAANIDFVGWQPCSQTVATADIPIRVEDSGPYALGLGRNIRHMLLNFDFNEWGCGDEPCNFNEVQRRIAIESIAIHEFGHALGLSHEQNRSDTPVSCDRPAQGPNGSRTFGEWDDLSVMNYCIQGSGLNLSTTDTNAVQFMYGASSAFVVRDANPLTNMTRSVQTNRFALDPMDPFAQWVAGDFNGDGVDELLSVQDFTGGARLAQYGYQNGSIQSVPSERDLAFDLRGERWSAADVDGDGADDLISVGRGPLGTTLRKHLSRAGRIASQEPDIDIAFSPNPSAQWLFGDMNGDGRSDLVQIEPDLQGVALTTRLAVGGRFGLSRQTTTLRLDNAAQSRWLLGDVTGDRRSDLVRITAKPNVDEVCVHATQRDGAVAAVPACRTYARTPAPAHYVVADLTANGRADLARIESQRDRARIVTMLSNGAAFAEASAPFLSTVGYWPGQRWQAAQFRRDAGAELVGLW